VCHSVHRANAIQVANTDNTAVDATDYLAYSDFTGTGLSSPRGYLTGTLSTCENCHVTMSGLTNAKPVEWPLPENAQYHDSAHVKTGGCVVCHKGRIHGGGGSKYNGMNAYMLGGESDDLIEAEFVAGNGSDKGFTDWFIGTAGDGKVYRSAANSFSTGSVDGVVMTPGAMAAGKANAAGYTCSREGCHNSSMFAVNKWGFASQRSDSATASVTGHRTNPGAGQPVPSGVGGNVPGYKENAFCGPCHPGNPAGGYRAVEKGTDGKFGVEDIASGYAPNRAKAYGCDQCHDAVGVKTGTTAWPHGNAGIEVWEWANDVAFRMGDPVIADATGGNLWMYQGNVAGFGAAGGNFDNDVSLIIDSQFTLVNGAVGDDGIIRDGVCLKCHVPYDSKSLEALSEVLVDGLVAEIYADLVDGGMDPADALFIAGLIKDDYMDSGVFSLSLTDLRAGIHDTINSQPAGIHGPGGIMTRNLSPNWGLSMADQYEPEGIQQTHLIWTYR
jgi:hypothetical protein